VRIIISISIISAILSIGCYSSQRVRDGRTAMELKQYAEAVALFQKEFDKTKVSTEKASIAFELAHAFRLLRQPELSEKWFEQAENFGFGVDATLWRARMLVQSEKYTEAQTFFTKAGKEQQNDRLYAAEIQSARNAIIWKSESENNEYTLMKLPFNSVYFDYAPFPLTANTLLFTSDRPSGSAGKIYKMTGNKFSNIFLSQSNGSDASTFGGIFSSNFNNASVCMNADQTLAAFVRCGSNGKSDDYCQLMLTQLTNGIWSDPEPAPFLLENVNYRTPTFSSDGRLLIFACDVPGGVGGYDLYVSEFFQGLWQDPISLGMPINSPSDEISPHMHHDTLYFASDRIGGMGGLDTYKSFLIDGKWSTPQNLKAPINSGFDDFNYVIDTFFKTTPTIALAGYIASNRKGGEGADDIYRFEKKIAQVPDKKLTGIDSLNARAKVLLEITTQEKEFIILDDPNSGVRFRKPMGSTRVQFFKDGTLQYDAPSNALGKIIFGIKDSGRYKVVGLKEGYLSGVFDIEVPDSLTNRQNDTLLEGRVLLEKIFINKEIILENIYYDYDRWEIRPDARPTLDLLVQLLQITPNIRISLGSHTDCRGTAEYNQLLSQKRAESAMAYLVEKGINPERLQAVGFGETKPLNTCICETCSEAEHQTNRRTTFTILE
jgi:peptidoglycan-associated lipoprotein